VGYATEDRVNLHSYVGLVLLIEQASQTGACVHKVVMVDTAIAQLGQLVYTAVLEQVDF
jgi:hypothetical protein